MNSFNFGDDTTAMVGGLYEHQQQQIHWYSWHRQPVLLKTDER